MNNQELLRLIMTAVRDCEYWSEETKEAVIEATKKLIKEAKPVEKEVFE